MNAGLPDLSRLTPEQRAAMRDAVLEEARVRKARRDLVAWFEQGPPTERGKAVAERWQRDAMRRLDGVLEEWHALPPGPRPIWIVNLDAPPQSGKSELTKRTLGYAMTRYGMSCGYASYAASLAVSHSVRIRALLRSPEARRVWPWLDGKAGRPDDAPKDTEDEWSIPAPTSGRLGPRLIARGRDGAMTGRVMDLIALDDLYKNSADYDSQAARNEVDGFLRSTVLARLMERGGLVLNVGTRWGIGDVRGWFDQIVRELVAAGATVRVESWSYPLKAREDDTMGRQPGEYLTDRWSPAKEAAARVFYGRLAPAILDCDPTPDEGALFKPSWLQHVYTLPPREQAKACERVWLSCDPNRKRTKAGSLAVVQVWGQIGTRRLLLHRWAERCGYTELRAAVRMIAKEWRCLPVLIEGAANGDPLVDDLLNEVDGIIAIPPRGEANRKWVDASAAAPFWESGQVLLPDATLPGCGWVIDFRSNVLAYTGDPSDETDDIDTMSQALLWSREAALDVAAFYEQLANDPW